jgi:hypothetical protein
VDGQKNGLLFKGGNSKIDTVISLVVNVNFKITIEFEINYY